MTIEPDSLAQISPTKEVAVKELPSDYSEGAAYSKDHKAEPGKSITDSEPESKILKAPTIEIETPSSSSPSSSDDEGTADIVEPHRAMQAEAKKGPTSSSSSSESEDESKDRKTAKDVKKTDGEINVAVKVEGEADRGTVSKESQELRERSSSSSDSEEYFETIGEPNDVKDQGFKVLTAEPNTEEKVVPGSGEPVLEDESKVMSKKKVTFDVPDKESESSSDSETDESTTSEKEESELSSDVQDKAKAGHKAIQDRPPGLLENEIKTIASVDHDEKSDMKIEKQLVETTDLDAETEDAEPKLLSYVPSEEEPMLFIETVSADRKSKIVPIDKTSETEGEEKERSSSSSSSSDSEDSDSKVRSYDVSKDSSHSSSEEEREGKEQTVKPAVVTDIDEISGTEKYKVEEERSDGGEIVSDIKPVSTPNNMAEIRSSGTSVVEMVEVTTESKYELAEGETDLDAVMLKNEKDFEKDTGLETVIKELRQIEKGELPELPPGYHDNKLDTKRTDETVIIAETCQTETTEYTPGLSVGDHDVSSKYETEIDSVLIEKPTDQVSNEKETQFISIPVKSEKPKTIKQAGETDIDTLIVELETIEKGNFDKERNTSSSSSSSADSMEVDKHADKEMIEDNKLDKPKKIKIYKGPDIANYDEKNVSEIDAEIMLDKQVKIDDPNEEFVSTIPLKTASLERVDIIPEDQDDKDKIRPEMNNDEVMVEEQKPWQCIYPLPDGNEGDEIIMVEEEKPWQCIYPLRDDDVRAESPENLVEIQPTRKSSSSSSDSSELKNDQAIQIEEQKPWQCIYPLRDEDLRSESPENLVEIEPTRKSSSSSSDSSELKNDQVIQIEEQKPWQCIYPLRDDDVRAESPENLEEIQPTRKSSSSSSVSSELKNDQVIQIEEQKPWQCIYPLGDDDVRAESPENLEEIQPTRKSSSSSSDSSELKNDEVIQIEEQKPWQCIYPLPDDNVRAESPELLTENQPTRKSSSSSSSDGSEMKNDQEIKLEEQKPWQCIYPLRDGDEKDEEIMVEEQKPWQCIYPLRDDDDERAKSPELGSKVQKESLDEHSAEKQPVHKALSSSSSSDHDESDTEKDTERETTRVESVIVFETPSVIKKPGKSVTLGKEAARGDRSSSASSDEENDVNKRVKHIDTKQESGSGDQMKGKPLVTDLDAELSEPKRKSEEMEMGPKKKLSSSSEDEAKEQRLERSSSSSSASSSDDEIEHKLEAPIFGSGTPAHKSLETDIDAVEPLPDTETPKFDDKTEHKTVTETDIDAFEPVSPDEQHESEAVVETVEPLHSPDVGFAPKHYPDLTFGTNVDTLEPEFTAYSIKSAIPVESPVKEGETKPPDDEVYCETSFTVVRRTKVKQTYASDKTERQPTMVEQAIQQKSTPALTDAADATGKRHRTESLSDEEEEDHPSKRQEFDTREEKGFVFGEDEAAPPAREFIFIEPALLTDNIETKTEHYKKEVPYVLPDDTTDEGGI